MTLDIQRMVIVPGDGIVVINGIVATELDMSSIPSNYRVVQWYGTWGEIEFVYPVGGAPPHNERIDSIAPFQTVIEEWVEATKPVPPPVPPEPVPPTPEQVTTGTMYNASGQLSSASYYSAPGVWDNIVPDSQYALKQWAASVTEILTKAQKILIDGTGEAYAPEFPPYPTLNPAPKAGEAFTVYFSEPTKKA